MSITERVLRSLDSLGVTGKDRLGVACSGGADSIALLDLLARTDRDVVVLHVDHQIRADSTQDADFVAATARSLGLPFFCERVDVDRSTGSLEAAARDARYSALARMAASSSAPNVATAHTLDDQAETVLLRLIRGGSLDAIAPRRGIFVRPLLDVRRAELREWLGREGIAWREDASNDDDRFERNWVRSTLLPSIAERRPGVGGVLARVARREREDHQALDALAACVFERTSIDDVGVFLRRADLALVPPAVASRVVRLSLRALDVDPSHDEIEAVRHLPSGRLRIKTVDVWTLHDGLALLPCAPSPLPAFSLPLVGVVSSQEWGIKVRVGPATQTSAWRWRIEVPEVDLVIRSRRPGDRVKTTAGSRKVQDVLVDAKVPRPLRYLVPIVTGGDTVLGVAGHVPRSETTVVSGRVVDVEPLHPTWSREQLWSSR